MPKVATQWNSGTTWESNWSPATIPLGKLFTHIASPVSQLQETGVQKGRQEHTLETTKT